MYIMLQTHADSVKSYGFISQDISCGMGGTEKESLTMKPWTRLVFFIQQLAQSPSCV